MIPVIVVPGIMGTNLKAKAKPRLGRIINEKNAKVPLGDKAWRPPNGMQEGLNASIEWGRFSAADRQEIFDGPTLEVDDAGAVTLLDAVDGYVLTEADVRQRGWGEVHADSYGILLHALQTRLNQTFGFDEQTKKRVLQQHWKDVMACEPQKWGVREFEPLTENHLVKHAGHYFPVYAVGYNWLEDCEQSSQRLEKRILEIIEFWAQAKRSCDKVILVTHSMGGLVTRACAKRIPDKIAGIIHGAMPAYGAPAAYRRLACGTESSSPDSNPLDNMEASALAKILGETTEKTTPVLATSPGALELLPNHLYPGPWLHVRITTSIGKHQAAAATTKASVAANSPASSDYLHLPGGRLTNPYDMYRDMTSWYRLINPALSDPADKYREKPGGVEKAIKSAIETAEKFHRALGDYYHPNTYAFYGADQYRRSYGRVRWVAKQQAGAATVVTAANVGAARFLSHTALGQRRVRLEEKADLLFELEEQDARGDGTVPHQSGMGPSGKAKQVFATQGYDHQGAYNHSDMLMLTLRLIVKIVQEMP
ncbi:esterase/lipase family protein [Massilia sp. CMS3.1]|uniref:esterase/lipase family protein n=1 Tax=Massilia sp. CMS3.1 TaxID=3373083 RepID=UPI003EE663A5